MNEKALVEWAQGWERQSLNYRERRDSGWWSQLSQEEKVDLLGDMMFDLVDALKYNPDE